VSSNDARLPPTNKSKPGGGDYSGSGGGGGEEGQSTARRGAAAIATVRRSVRPVVASRPVELTSRHRLPHRWSSPAGFIHPSTTRPPSDNAGDAINRAIWAWKTGKGSE